MTVKECYEKIGADYEGVLQRFGSEVLVKKFALKFLNDASFQNLQEALKNRDAEEAFRASHTLKGICANLGLDNLYTVSSDLTEQLRGRSLDGYEEKYKKVEEQYHLTAEAIEQIA